MEKFPSSPESESDIQGEGFVIKNRQETIGEGAVIRVNDKEVYKVPPERRTSASALHPLEMRHGESTDAAIERQKEKPKNREVKMADFFEHMFVNNEYSETLIINPDGHIDEYRRTNDDKRPLLPEYTENTADLYRFMKEVQGAHPEYNISFENDPNGKWIKYKIRKEK